MSKNLIKAIIPLCIFILFVSMSLQNFNNINDDTAIEVMASIDDENIEEKNINKDNGLWNCVVASNQCSNIVADG